VGGYQSLFEKNVVHRDIKPANLIFNGDEIKICDLGFAKIVDDKDGGDTNTILGTPLYMSPQLLNCDKYTNKCDMWALGFVLYQMFYHPKTPWSGSSQIRLLENITKEPLLFPATPKISDETKDLIKKMLAFDEDARISWLELFKHPLILKGKK